MTPAPRRTVRLVLVPALALVAVLAGCGDDDSEGSDAVETVTVEATGTPTESATESAPTTTEAPTTSAAPPEGCEAAPPAGEVATPADAAAYTTGSGGLAIELSDGTTDCVTFAATEGAAGEWDVDSTELLVELGSPEAGLHLTLTDYTDDGVDDIAANQGDPFTGIQYADAYWVDSFHSACTVDLLAFTATASAGTFDCGSDLVPWAGGPWNAAENEVTVVSATGWWSIGV